MIGLQYMRMTMALVILLSSLPVTADATQQDDERERLDAALKDCSAQIGIDVPKLGHNTNAKISEIQRADFESCLERQGARIPDRPPPFGPASEKIFQQMRACLDSSGVGLPEPRPGKFPDLNASQRSALDKCRAEFEVQKKDQ